MRIDTQPPGETPEDNPAEADVGPTDNLDPLELEAALAQLRQAAADRQVDPICQAYEALREAGGDMPSRDLLALAGQRMNVAAAGLVISAYSHRHCYMCDNGTIVCDSCEGTGQDAEGRPCLQCDGLGLTVCGFCGGTGWADRASIPRELSKAVTKRQLGHVQTDLKELQQIVAKLGREEMAELPIDRRGALAGRLIRVQARLEEMGRSSICDEKHAAYVAKLVSQVEAYLEVLRR